MQNPVTLIAGALTGIGRAAALGFAKEGVAVVVSGHRKAEGKALEAELRDLSVNAAFISSGVRHEESVRTLVDQPIARFGRRDTAVNNAGTEGKSGSLIEQTRDAYAATFDTNVLGTPLSLKHKLPMGVKRVINGVCVIPMGMANAFLIEGDEGLILIDAGFPGKETAVFRAIRGLGRSPDQLKHLIFTHGHPDHIGSAAAVVRETGARTYMHPLDIPMAESGGPFRPMRGAPGLLRRAMCKLFYHPDERLEPVAIDQPLTDGEILPIAGGIEVIHSPGHCAGQVALLWRPGRMLFAGDVCTNLMGLGDPVGFESLEEGRASQRKLASLSFDAAGFGHGKPIARDASTRFRNKWGEKSSA
jgi:glyoxylase-like metal-dependent hydrolase (beta-lactamase superfamily II)